MDLGEKMMLVLRFQSLGWQAGLQREVSIHTMPLAAPKGKAQASEGEAFDRSERHHSSNVLNNEG